MALPPLDWLESALAARRHGSFSAAAEALGVTHAAVSRRIVALESWVGRTLFDRHGRGVTVNAEGQRYLARIEHALDAIEHAGDRWRKAPQRGRVTVGATPSFIRFWLLPRLARLEGDPPDLRIELLADQRIADLDGGAVDLAIRHGRGGWRTGREERLLDERLIPAASPALTGARAAASRIADLPLLHDADSTGWRAWFQAHGLPFRAKPADRVLADYGLAMAAAAAGLGVALASDRLIERAPALLLLDRLAVASPLAHYLLHRPEDGYEPAQRLAARLRAAAASG